MNTELIDLLVAYLKGWKTISDCAEWLAGVVWDDPDLAPETRNLLGRLELIVTEVAEELRPEAEFSQEAAAIVAPTLILAIDDRRDLSEFSLSSSNADVQINFELEAPGKVENLQLDLEFA